MILYVNRLITPVLVSSSRFRYRTTRKFGEHGEYNLYLSTCAITEKRAPIISDLRRFFLNPVLPESGSIAIMTAVLTSTQLSATYLALAILLAALLVYCMICLIFRLAVA
jgi:hypothetical protein